MLLLLWPSQACSSTCSCRLVSRWRRWGSSGRRSTWYEKPSRSNSSTTVQPERARFEGGTQDSRPRIEGGRLDSIAYRAGGIADSVERVTAVLLVARELV